MLEMLNKQLRFIHHVLDLNMQLIKVLKIINKINTGLETGER